MLKIRMHHSKGKGAGTLIKEVLAYSSMCCAWWLQPITALESAYWLGCGGCLASIGRGLLSPLHPSIQPPQSAKHTSERRSTANESCRAPCMSVNVCQECQEERERHSVDQLLLNHCRSIKSGTVTDTEGEREDIQRRTFILQHSYGDSSLLSTSGSN